MIGAGLADSEQSHSQQETLKGVVSCRVRGLDAGVDDLRDEDVVRSGVRVDDVGMVHSQLLIKLSEEQHRLSHVGKYEDVALARFELSA